MKDTGSGLQDQSPADQLTINIMAALTLLRVVRPREALQRCIPVLAARDYSSSSTPPARTCLYDFHVEKGGKMVSFAGYSMPVEYSDMGIIPSHLHTRSRCSIFDVSHMLQTRVHGKVGVYLSLELGLNGLVARLILSSISKNCQHIRVLSCLLCSGQV